MKANSFSLNVDIFLRRTFHLLILNNILSINKFTTSLSSKEGRRKSRVCERAVILGLSKKTCGQRARGSGEFKTTALTNSCFESLPSLNDTINTWDIRPVTRNFFLTRQATGAST